MENNIDLSNNYQIKLISENNLPKEAINIEEINMQKIKKRCCSYFHLWVIINR